jgi:glycosyltransferase involved in cell wall biosynthesis
MKILVIPRENNNPYQSILYKELERHGVSVEYGCLLTSSQTLNQLLLPIETLVRRIAGTRLTHIHWTYGFEIYGSSRYPFLRTVSEAWFYLWLWTVRISGMRLVWTAHNVLPIGPRFTDDIKARRRLVDASDLVIAHSRATLAELAELGIVPHKSVVIPHGPYQIVGKQEELRIPASTPGPRKFLFLGMMSEYKGIDTLLTSFANLPPGLDAELTVVGECVDPSLQASLRDLARASTRRIELRFERVPEAEVSQLLEGADAMVLPYRKSTTSGSALLALSHGRPLIVPSLPGLAELPEDAVMRYDRTVEGLTKSLADLIGADGSVLAKMSEAGYAYCASLSWESIARKTLDEMDQTLSSKSTFTRPTQV